MTGKQNLVAAAGIVVVALIITAIWLVRQQPDVDVPEASPQALLDDGIRHFDAKEYELALEVLAQVPPDSAQGARALYYQGSTYVMLKEYDIAASRLEQALALNPQDTGTLYALGVAYYKVGNLALAKGYFAKVLEINPNDEHAKSLMDVMAKLERQSAPEPPTE